ncbi:unnamed protein product [Closterium sp. NIES-53]
MYLMTCTRPDLAYPLSILACYMAPSRHRKVHWDAAKRVLRYLCSTSGMGLVFGGRGPAVFTGHADASWVDDSATQRSKQGYTFSLSFGSVSWRSTRSSSVLSSNFLYVDNKAMVALCQEHRLEHITKHIALRYFLARELQQRGQLRLAYVATRANTADILTKALPPGAGESALSGTASAQVLHTFTLDSGASRSFFRDRTTLTPLSRPVAVSLADPSGGTVLASFSTVLPCPAAPSGSLSGLYLPSFSTNLVSGADLQDQGVDQFTPASQRLTHCMCARTGRHLATYSRRPGSSLYTLSTKSPPLSASGQVATSSQVFAAASGSSPESAPCSCRLLSHQTLLWQHRLGHPSLPRLRGMASRVLGHERYFLLVVDDYSRYTTIFPLHSKGEVTEVLIDWIRAARLRLRESFGSDFPVLRLHSDRGGEISSARLGAFCRAQGIRQTFTLPASPQQNGIAERRIGMVMDVARTSMIHAAAPHFLWPFAVQYAAHQLNLQPRVSLPETSPTLRWTGKVGDASAFRVWGSRAFVRDLSADKLSPRATPCVFLGFPPDAPGWQFYHPTSRRVLSSQNVTFDESVPYYRLFPYRTTPLPPPPLFLAPGPPPVDPLPPRGPAPSGVSQVDVVEPVEVAIDSGAATGAEPAGAGSGGAESGGAETEGAEPGGVVLEGAESGGSEPGVAEPGGAEPWGAEPGGTEPGGAEPGGARSARVASRGASSRREVLSPQELREWFARRWGRAAGAGGTTAATGSGGTCPGGTGATGVGPTGVSAGASGGAGAAGSAGTGAAGATGVGAAGGVGAGETADAGPSEGAGAGAVGAGGAAGAGAAAERTGAVPTGSGGATRPKPYFVPLLEQVLGLPLSPGPAPPLNCPQPDQSQSPLQPVSPLPAPSPYTGPTGGLAERRVPASRPASPARPSCTSRRTSRPRPPAVPGTHQMTLRPSTAPLRVPLPSPPASSLPSFADPESDSLRAASPTVARFLATVVTDPSLASTAASALVAELVDFAARCRLDYAASLVAKSASVCPPSVGGECALGTDGLDDRQEEFQCFAAALPHLVSTLLAPEGDPDALDIPTPRSYAEAIEGPYSSQWQAAMDAEMASWKSTGTYVDEVPPPGANIVSGMWIFRVKRPPGSPPVFKARYVARGFSQRQGVDYFQTSSPTPKMTTLRVLLHVAAQRDYELHSLDFSTAFLQGSPHEEIWLRRPPGFTGSFPPGTQCSLRRPVYGLRQAPREWHDTLRTTLAALGFAPSTADPSLFLRTDTSLPPFYVLVYVDDLVFATADTAGLAHVKSELQKRHTCTDLGELRSYLGLQITRDRAQRTITLTQSHMVQQVLQCFDFTYSSPQATPLSTRHSLSALPSDESVEPSGPYPELVGCLMYLMTCTRPDLAYPLSILARYVAPGRHRPEHMAATKRVLRYLCSTSGMGLVLGGRRLVVLTGHADASWADDQATQQSSQGYTFSLGSGSVLWRSTRSSSVLSFSCEAEIYAGAMAAQELRWLTYLLTDLGEQPRSPPALYVDNKAMLALCQEHRLEHRTKHIALHYFLARELQQRGQLRLAYVATEANTADIFTKALAPAFFALLDWSCDLLDHFLFLDPTSLTVDVLEQHLLAPETSAVAKGAARGTPPTPFFKGCSPSPLAPSYAPVGAVDVLSTEDVGAASARAKRPSSKGKGGRGGGGGSGGGGGGSSGGSGKSGGGGSGGSGGGSGGVGGGGGGSDGSGGSGSGGTGGGRTGAQHGGSGGEQRQRQQRRSETPSPEQLRDRAGQTCGKVHTQHQCFSRLDDAWCAEFGNEVERPHWAELLRSGVAIFDLHYDAILSAMYALFPSAEGDCYQCVPPDPGIEAAALGASESSLSSTVSAEALHTFTLDSGASCCFFRDSTTLTPLPAPVPVRLADPSEGPVVARSSIVLPCPAYRCPPGRDGHYHHSWGSACVDLHVYTDGSTPGTFTRRPGSSLYTLATKPPQVAPPCSCRLLSHQTLLWHHRLGHPSLPRLRGMHSRLLVSSLPRTLPPLLPSPAPPCLPCIEGRQRAAPHSSFPPTTTPVQTLHMDVWGPARASGLGRERYILLVVDDYTWTFLSCVCTLTEVRRIGLVMEVVRTSMIHAAAPHFLWPFAARYAVHQLNLWPRVSFLETSPTLRWTGKVGDASVFRVWGSRAFVSDTSADKLSARTIPCAFLGFSPDPPGFSVTNPRRDMSSPLKMSHPLLGTAPAEVAVGSGAARGAASGGVASWGAEPGVAESEGAGSGLLSLGVRSPGWKGAESRDAEPRDAASSGGPAGASSRLSLQKLGEWLVRRARLWSGATGAGAAGAGGAGVTAGAGGTGGTVAAGLGGARTRGTGAAGTGGVRGAGAGDPTEPGATKAGGSCAGGAGAGGAGAGGTGDGGAGAGEAGAGGTDAGGAGAEGAGVEGTGAGGAGAGGSGAVNPTGPMRPRPYFVLLLQQVLGVPSSTSLTPPLLCPPDQTPLPLQPASPCLLLLLTLSSPAVLRRGVSLGLVLPPFPSILCSTAYSFDRTRDASPTVSRLLATAVTEPSFESTAASTFIPELLDFAAASRLDYATALVAESDSARPPSVGDAPDIPTPRSYAKAITGPYSSQWQEAIDAKMASWKSTSTYVNEVPPPGANIVDGMWIFRGVDYFQTFSPTPKMTTLRVLLHIATQCDYEFQSLDFSTAFLQGSLHEEIWLRHPPGFTGSFPAGTQWSLWRPVYSLCQAPRKWHDTLRTTLAALGFTPSTADPSLFLRTDTSLPPLYVLVYVDDLVLATADSEALTLVKSLLQKRHTCTDLGPSALRVSVLLATAHSSAYQPLALSSTFGRVHRAEWSVPRACKLPMYLMTCTRPDLAYPLSLLARYVAPGRHQKVHLDAAKRVLRYLCSTSGMGLVLGVRGPVVLTGHAYDSWVDDSATQRSSQGYTFSLGSGSVSWRSTRSSSVLGSSCEAEIYAGAMAAQELRWLTYLLADLG